MSGLADTLRLFVVAHIFYLPCWSRQSGAAAADCVRCSVQHELAMCKTAETVAAGRGGAVNEVHDGPATCHIRC